ncbi:outer membrane beta-barrel protein [Alloacidobacterium sp.]|uniref:outer membrane beta-barrel protein n=1 Tax=Alloacidobacterium sp. TaxID=2951999 RepID=UPI002D40FC9E|nr:outer membrane beta-barrel protein [Alloacidobacterium sp.]HYK35807.1 outer membrane beta-barrel protein [Alloacidobacterium sp.]
MMLRFFSCSFAALTLFAAFSLTTFAYAQTDAAASFYGAFNGTTAANGTVQSPSNSAGFLLELRHISNPLVGYELNYSFNRANQNYNDIEEIKAAAHEVGADWFVSFPVLMLKPFVLAGGGIIFFHPDSDQPDSTSDTKPAFVYGAGVDWTVIPHLGLRFQYRGNLYHAPDLSHAFSSTDAFTHTAEPMIGAYLRF